MVVLLSKEQKEWAVARLASQGITASWRGKDNGMLIGGKTFVDGVITNSFFTSSDEHGRWAIGWTRDRTVSERDSLEAAVEFVVATARLETPL